MSTGGKGSRRRDGIIPPTAWEAIFTATPQTMCGLCRKPVACCGCVPTDDGPGQDETPETEKGTEDANAK